MGVFDQKVKEVGEPGEQFVAKHVNQLLPKGMAALKVAALRSKVKGADVLTITATEEPLAEDDFAKDVMKEWNKNHPGEPINEEKAVFYAGLQRGFIEVKTLKWEPGTVRNDMDCEEVLIGFEMWENQASHQSSPGWLRALIYPEQANEYAKIHFGAYGAVQPLALVFLLERPAGEQTDSKYHACVCFYDVKELEERIISLLPLSWDLNDTATIYASLQADKRGVTRFENGTFFQKNGWWIPISVFSDMVEITKIDNEVQITEQNRNGCMQAEARLRNLYDAATQEMRSSEMVKSEERVVEAVKALFGKREP